MSNGQSGHLAIIGGGVAGLAAAVAAVAKGLEPLLIEATPHLGGRARSIHSNDVNAAIDNGQHALSASYTVTRQFLELIGSSHTVDFQPRLSIGFALSAKRSLRFRSWLLPAPFHFIVPMLTRLPIPDRERKAFFQWVLVSRKLSDESLAGMSVREWLQLAPSCPILEQMLWEPITLATLNTPLNEASALLLKRVLDQAFLGKSRSCGLGIANVPLSEVLADPAERYIRANGGIIKKNTAIRRIHVEDNKVVSIESRRGELLPADALILAIPPRPLVPLLRNSAILPALADKAAQFKYAAIITIHLWLKKRIECECPLAFIDSPLHWLFTLPYQSESSTEHYAIVISAADALIAWHASDLLALADREFKRFFGKGIGSGFGLTAYKVVKEKRATFLQTPASLRLRPAARTSISNLFLAGDWTDTGLPATIEAAAISGYEAVDARCSTEQR